MADIQLEDLRDIAARSAGLRYDSAEAQTIHGEGDWTQYYPEVDGYGYLTGRVIDDNDDRFLVVHDWAMVEACTLSAEDLRLVDEGWFPVWRETTPLIKATSPEQLRHPMQSNFDQYDFNRGG